MGKRTIIAIAVVAVLLLAVGLVLYFHQPTKPARTHRVQPGWDSVQTNREFVGVGLQLRMDSQAAGPVIVSVVPNTPAATAGITSGLMVSKVDDVPLEGKPLAECVGLIRGLVGTTVKLELIAPDGSHTNTVQLTRQKLKL